MSNAFVGEIRTFAFGYPPRNTAQCNGQTMQIAQNQALFALIGVTYGGDGRTNFLLPDLRSRVPLHVGQGTGLSNYALGQKAGTESVTLTTQQMPQHTHTFSGAGSVLNAVTDKGMSQVPSAGSQLAKAVDGSSSAAQPLIYFPAGSTNTVPLGGLNVAGTNAIAGGNQPTPILQPYLTLNFCIQLNGIYPSRN